MIGEVGKCRWEAANDKLYSVLKCWSFDKDFDKDFDKGSFRLHHSYNRRGEFDDAPTRSVVGELLEVVSSKPAFDQLKKSFNFGRAKVPCRFKESGF